MKRRGFTEEDYDQMAQMRERGKTCAQIARRFKCSAELVSWQCLRLGADVPNAKILPQTAPGPAVMKRGDHECRRFTPAEDEIIDRMTRDGAGPTEIGRELKRARNSVLGRMMTLARHESRRESRGLR